MGSKKNWSRKSRQFFSMLLAGVITFQSGAFGLETYAAELNPDQQNIEENRQLEGTEENIEIYENNVNDKVEESEKEIPIEEETNEILKEETITEENIIEEDTTEEMTTEEIETEEATIEEEKVALQTFSMTREANENEKIFAISELKETASWNLVITPNDDGSSDFLFTKQHGAISYKIPDSIDVAKLDKIICNTSDFSKMSLKFLEEETMQETEIAVCYESNTLSTSKISAGTPVCIAIMGLEEGYKTTIESVTFVLKEEQEEIETNDGDLTAACFKNSGNNNPLMTQRYGADPGVMVYEDTAYVYMTNDAYEYDANGNIMENSYSKIQTLNCISSTDLVNWTDHGTIKAAGKSGAAKWANNSWAPCATYKEIDGEDKFFLYFADNGGGIGVLTADNPTGPWIDPLGEGLITRKTPNCSNVEWLFDPAVFVDDDGTGYLYFGGGVPNGKNDDPGTARVVRLGDDMISLDCDPVQINPPYLFEDSGINKIGDTYYYSYCSNWNTTGSKYSTAAIEYMTSDNPMGPFTYAGEMFENPGVFLDGSWGNNHHTLFELKGNYYLAYHARALEQAVLGESLGYRSTQIDEVTINDGKIEAVEATMTGVSQVEKLNPFQTVSATTIARQKGIEVDGSGNPALTVTDGDWTCVKGVDFKTGLTDISIKIKADEDMSVEVRVGSEKGSLLGKIDVEDTDGSYEEFSAQMKNISGIKDVYFVFKGNAEVESWKATAGEGGIDVDIETDVPDLKNAVTEEIGSDFMVGAAIMINEITDENLMALVTKHFNAVTFANELKPDAIFNYSNNRCPGTETAILNGEEITVPITNFDRAERMLDKIYEWNEKNPNEVIKIRGHVLTWHSQTPEWFFHEDYDASKPYVDTDTMTMRHEWYIKTVLEHFTGEDSKYKDMFYGWDVVNEAVSDGRGTYRNASENSTWWAVYQSQEFIINAFRFANKYAPADLELYYNDYNEWVDSKVKGIAQLLKDVKEAEGTRIDGMGMQGHYATAGSPSMDDFKAAAKIYADIVGKIQITELDYKASSAYDGTDATYDAENTRLAYRYKELYDAVKELRAENVNVTNITVWGVIDKNSWLQTSNSVGGASDGRQKQIPLLFDDDYKVKPAYWAFVDSSKLAPEIQIFDILQCEDLSKEDTCFENGYKLTFGEGIVDVEAIPVWSSEGLKVKVTVKDVTKEAADAVTVYLSENGKIQSVTANRSEGIENADGYTVVVSVPCMAETLAVTNEVRMDFVVTAGEQKIAYSDKTMSQKESDQYYARATLKPFIVISKGSVTVDGEMEDAWKSAANVPLTINLGSKVEADAKLLWDEENLYVYAKVKDAVLNADSTAAHEQDSVEVFIDENNNKSSKYEADDKQYRINYMNTHSFNGTKCLEENMKSYVKRNEQGYEMELAFAWTDIKPVSGDKIGIELQVNDADESGKRIGTLSWYDKSGSGWENPSVFGTAILSDASASDTPPEEDTPPEGDASPEGGTPSQGGNQSSSQGNSNRRENRDSESSNTVRAASDISVGTNIQDARVPLAPTVNEAGLSLVNVSLDREFKLKSELFLQYRGFNVFLMTYLSNGIGYSIHADQEINEDIKLQTDIKTLPDFAEGFTTMKIEQAETATLTYQIGMHVNLGVEYQGKTAYIFKRNLATETYEIADIVTINQIGNVAIMTNEVTDVMIMIAD